MVGLMKLNVYTDVIIIITLFIVFLNRWSANGETRLKGKGDHCQNPKPQKG